MNDMDHRLWDDNDVIMSRGRSALIISAAQVEKMETMASMPLAIALVPLWKSLQVAMELQE